VGGGGDRQPDHGLLPVGGGRLRGVITELGHDGDAARIEGVVPEDRAAAIIATTVDGTEVLDEAIESPRFSREVDARTGVTFRVQLRDDVVYALSELRADPPP
jgi:hypothetical protein